MRPRRPALGRRPLAFAPLVFVFAACGSEAPGSVFDDDGVPVTGETSSAPTGSFATGPAPVSCQGLACQQVQCDDGKTTTLTGVVTAPNGSLPLYNAIVYVPNAPLDPMPRGASCDRCGHVSGKPLVSAVSDVEGKFVLENVPVGQDIPLVVQIGKWRRLVTVPAVERCVDNPVTRALTRLPKNQSEGDIPQIAVTTGRCDQLACLLPKLGLDASEFTPDSGPGRLHVYRGAAHPNSAPVPAPAPAGSRDATALYGDLATLEAYDIVMLSCECGEHNETKPPEAKQTLYDFMNEGGRVFASHFHYAWANETPLAATAEWMGSPANPENPPGPYLVDRSFPKGEAFARWLVSVDATQTLGEVPISQPRENVGGVLSPTQRWVYRERAGDADIPEATKYLTVNTPVDQPIDNQCGKFVFADMHLYGLDVQDPATALPDDAFPGSCSSELTPEEKALAFLFFDLSSCIQDETLPPLPPVH
jgi:hypothetical protein